MAPKRGKRKIESVSSDKNNAKRRKLSEETNTKKNSKGKKKNLASTKAKTSKTAQAAEITKSSRGVGVPSAATGISNKLSSNVNDDSFLLQFFDEGGWRSSLQKEFDESYFKTMDEQLKKEYSDKLNPVFPAKENIFAAFNKTPIEKVKVVIIGQDPYHDNGQAHGLCFSVPTGVDPPPSLKNIFKELANDIKGFSIPKHGCLERWAAQGVLLLNATLTVRAHTPNSHSQIGWQRFTDAAITSLNKASDGCVFILWGGFAHKKAKLIDVSKHYVIKAAHPSPLSFNKFFGCKCFSEVNRELQKKGLAPIDWTV